MKIGSFFMLTIVFLAFFIANTAFAISVGSIGTKVFSGRILNTKALEISLMEATNFLCLVHGTTITIKPNGLYPKSYFISAGTMPATKTTPTAGQQILGLYSTIKTPITCTFKGTPPATKIVNLSTIIYFGTSKN